ncbi:hypothetical protein [Rhodophyticola sp. CCM32]|uniref:hypothetical protein n=1 Tax=Rhodophyticola sp. CCM32 TaxID=2916397 RepID=UPI001AEFDFD2|nr:hypothetical protein [Rhodophyticola sp. CCM32]
MSHMLISTLVVLALATPVQAAKFQFCWIGGAGYTMRGTIRFPDALLNTGLITERDVTYFAIYGFHDGIPIGSWSLADRLPATTWTLSFDTDTLAFPMGGIRSENSYQAWNANGRANDCGAGGFGFNGGDYAQDVCIDNTYINMSSIDPNTPLQAHPEGLDIPCEATMSLSWGRGGSDTVSAVPPGGVSRM